MGMNYENEIYIITMICTDKKLDQWKLSTEQVEVNPMNLGAGEFMKNKCIWRSIICVIHEVFIDEVFKTLYEQCNISIKNGTYNQCPPEDQKLSTTTGVNLMPKTTKEVRECCRTNL